MATKPNKPTVVHRAPLAMRRWIKLFQCLSCGFTFGNFETKYTTCTQCSSHDFVELTAAYEDYGLNEGDKN